MVYSRELGYVYYSIPKCATHTMYRVFMQNYKGKRYGEFHYYGKRPSGTSKYALITTKRNPYDRAVSAFWGIEQHKTLTWGNDIFNSLKKKGHIKELFKWALEFKTEDIPTGWLRPQMHYINIVGIPDYFIDIDDIYSSLWGLPFVDRVPKSIPKANASSHPPWKLVIKDQELVSLINRLYEPDFEGLGYKMITL